MFDFRRKLMANEIHETLNDDGKLIHLLYELMKDPYEYENLSLMHHELMEEVFLFVVNDVDHI